MVIGAEFYVNISYMLSHLFLMLFIYIFIVHRYSKEKTAGTCFVVFVLLCMTDCLKLNIFPDSNLCYVIVTLFQIFAVQFTGIFIAKERNSKILFIGLTASNYVIAGSIVSTILYFYTGNSIFSFAGSFAVHFVILLFLVVKIRNIWHAYQSGKTMGSWWPLCLIPALFYCGFSFLSFFPYTLDENPRSIPGVLFFVITMFASYVIVFHYVESESSRHNVYWKNVLFASYIRGLENQYYLVEQSEKNLKILRHDMRHFSGMIDSLLEQGEYDEIRKVTRHINDVADENRVAKYCDNLIVNTVLSNMMEKAEQSDIEVRQNFWVPKEVPVNAYEFASVIANLFENALFCVKDFAKEKRYVDAKIDCSADHLLIHMQNVYEEKIQFDEHTGLPQSRAGGEHGLGMQSVLAFSDKIGGNIGAYCENGFFHIMLFAKFREDMRRTGNIPEGKE
ncbi:MAG: GHKL domain-containing protein [Lachnospiraceae bacterium]|nr:GHKL domain-containing protein [Lachnospiraceae bacterium]